MPNAEYARDLLFTAVLFGTVTFMWAGWAQERPPVWVAWRVVLGAFSVGGLALLGLGLPTLVRHWSAPTAMVAGGTAFVVYVVVFWLEVAAIVALAILYARTGRNHLLAPTVLIVVGVHFVPLSFVFQQPIMLLAAVLITAAGVASLFLPRRIAAPSFWCGVLASPVFLVLGMVSLVTGRAALAG